MCCGENTTGKGTVVIHRECHPEKSQQAHSLFKEQPACGPLVLVLTVRKKKYVLRKRDRRLEMKWKQKRTEEHTDPANQNKANILELLVNM